LFTAFLISLQWFGTLAAFFVPSRAAGLVQSAAFVPFAAFVPDW
jgi:hypothetical protein